MIDDVVLGLGVLDTDAPAVSELVGDKDGAKECDGLNVGSLVIDGEILIVGETVGVGEFDADGSGLPPSAMFKTLAHGELAT